MTSTALLGLLLATALPGTETRTVHEVPLLRTRPSDCVSVRGGQGIAFVLDRADVEAMATPRPTQWTTEEERMRLVRSGDARALLKGATGHRDALGCEVLEESGRGIYALMDIVAAGRGRAWDATTGTFLPSVERLEYNLDCRQGGFGTYTFRKPGGEEFMFIPGCII